MDEADTFFTHTIVGPPYSVLLGRRLSGVETIAQGIAVHLPSGQQRLSQAWNDWIVLNHASDAPGRPRRRPGRLRRLLERHALWVAVLGLAALGVAGLAVASIRAGVLPWN